MPRHVHLLLGFPGTGKYTVAKELVAQLEERGHPTRLVDAHYVNNPIFGLVHQDGSTPLDPRVWERVREVRGAILQTIEELSPPDWSFVFTNFITTREVATPSVAAYLTRLQGLARLGGQPLRTTRLTCDLEELSNRIARADRVDRMKMTDGSRAREWLETETIYDPGDALTLDITRLHPKQAALRILEHASSERPRLRDPKP